MNTAMYQVRFLLLISSRALDTRNAVGVKNRPSKRMSYDPNQLISDLCEIQPSVQLNLQTMLCLFFNYSVNALSSRG